MWHKVQVGLYLIPLSAVWVALVSSQRDRASQSAAAPAASVTVAAGTFAPPEPEPDARRARIESLRRTFVMKEETAADLQEQLRLVRKIIAEQESQRARGDVGPFTIAVTGSVAFPGSYSVLAGNMTARRAINGAGGPLESDATISLNRTDDSGSPIRFKVSSKDADAPLRAGDVITVE